MFTTACGPVGGGGTFARIVANLQRTVDHVDVSVRVNADRHNVNRLEELLAILVSHGLAGRLTIYLGHLVPVDDGAPAPSVTYGAHRCFTGSEFAVARAQFAALAESYVSLAVRCPGRSALLAPRFKANEIIVGSDDELYKCPESQLSERTTPFLGC